MHSDQGAPGRLTLGACFKQPTGTRSGVSHGPVQLRHTWSVRNRKYPSPTNGANARGACALGILFWMTNEAKKLAKTCQRERFDTPRLAEERPLAMATMCQFLAPVCCQQYHPTRTSQISWCLEVKLTAVRSLVSTELSKVIRCRTRSTCSKPG